MDRKQSRRTVTVFALASFLNDLGSDMIYPIWPMFITTGLGASMSVLGFLDGLGDALVSISQAASGYLSDRIRKRKVFVWLGYLLGSGSRIGYAVSGTCSMMFWPDGLTSLCSKLSQPWQNRSPRPAPALWEKPPWFR